MSGEERFDPVRAMAEARHEFGEYGGVNMSIEASTTFTVLDPATMPQLFQGLRGPDTGGCYLYGRHYNPTVYGLGHQLAAMEGTETAYCTASGMSAIASVIMQLCKTGDHIVSGRAVYGGTFALLKDFLPSRAGLHVTFTDTSDLGRVEAAFTPHTRVLYVESISNPTLAVADIPRLAAIAHAHDATLVVDNTFAPLILSPAKLGADVVVHSLTKYVSGASDIIGGVVCGTHDFIAGMMDLHTGSLMLLGPTMDPHMAFNLCLRLPHLPLRMKEHGARALLFARRLAACGVPVSYPGLESHPQNPVLRRLGNAEFGAGGILALDLGTVEAANRFMDLLQNKYHAGYMAVSLGYFDTLMSCSSSSTSSELSDEERANAGISPGLVRLSIGITGTVEQRWQQISGGLMELGLCQAVAAGV